MRKIGIIGGSGFYSIASSPSKRVDTPFGQSGEIVELEEDGVKIFFLARHGKGHSVAPHLINYRANIFALKKLGVSHVIATNAVGSCNLNMEPGHFVLPDQIIDFTSERKHTFYEGADAKGVPDDFKKVEHVDVSEPFNQEVRSMLKIALGEFEQSFHEDGTIGVFNGPRYETPAEIKMAQSMEIDIVGMTSAPEAFLARELDLKYATIAVVTNFAAGMQEKVSHDEVVEMFNDKIEIVKNVTIEAAKQILI